MLKKICIMICILITFQSFGEKIRIAIIDFSAKGEVVNESYLADAVVENLITAFIDSGEFIVMERSMLKEIMRELQLQNSDDFNDDLRNQIGNLYGAELVILGSLTKIGSRYTINVRGVEVETGIARFAKNLVTDSKESLVDLIPQIVYLITGKTSKEDIEKDMKKKDKTKVVTETRYDDTYDTGDKTEYESTVTSTKPSITINKTLFNPGEQIELQFSAPRNFANNAWIGIIPSQVIHGSESKNDMYDITFQYINKQTSGTMTFYAPVDTGSYDFRMHDTDNNGTEVYSITFTVKEEQKAKRKLEVASSKKIYYKDEPIIVVYSGLPGNKTDWITIVKSGSASNTYNEWFYTEGQKSGRYTFKPLPPGDYEIRIFYNWPEGKYIIQAKYPFSVAE